MYFGLAWEKIWFIKPRVRYTEGSLYRKSVCSPNTGKYGPEKTLYLDTFHAVYESWIIIVASVSLRSLLFLVIQHQTKVYYTFNYFLIRFAQTKITLFIFVNKWVIRENESFLLVEPCSRRAMFSCNMLRWNKITIILS